MLWVGRKEDKLTEACEQTSYRIKRVQKREFTNSMFTPSQGWLPFKLHFSPHFVCSVLLTLHSSFLWSSWAESGDYQDHKVGWHHFATLISLVTPEPILKS